MKDFDCFAPDIKEDVAYRFAAMYLAGAEAELLHARHDVNRAVVFDRSQQDLEVARKCLALVNRRHGLIWSRLLAKNILIHQWATVLSIADRLTAEGKVSRNDLAGLFLPAPSPAETAMGAEAKGTPQRFLTQ